MQIDDLGIVRIWRFDSMARLWKRRSIYHDVTTVYRSQAQIGCMDFHKSSEKEKQRKPKSIIVEHKTLLAQDFYMLISDIYSMRRKVRNVDAARDFNPQRNNMQSSFYLNTGYGCQIKWTFA